MPAVRRTIATALTVLTAAAATLTTLVVAGDAEAARPSGAVTTLQQFGSGVRATGWASDPDVTTPSVVYLRVDGRRGVRTTANRTSASHGSHGFDLRSGIRAGTHEVCVVTPDYPTGNLVAIGCRTMTFDYDPVGVLDPVVQSPGAVTLSGWALDGESPRTALRVALRVDGRNERIVTANSTYPGLAASHPVAGGAHGFRASVPITEGPHLVCARAANLLAGSATFLCQQMTISFSPAGGIRTVRQIPGGLHIEGYAKDPDTTATTSVTVAVNGAAVGTARADGQFGYHRGYGFRGDFLLPGTRLAPGRRTVCVTARNLGSYGRDTQVGCWVASFDWNPRTSIWPPTQHAPGALVTGWAYDPDSTAALTVRVTSDGVRVGTVTANRAGADHPGHQFRVTVPLQDGRHLICATAQNVRYGSGDSAPACKYVTVNFSPYGALESVRRAAGSTDVVATGWAIDPSTTAPITVRANVDDAMGTPGIANLPRADVAAKHPGTGTSHGYAIRVAADDSEHRVCSRAMNTGNGLHSPQLGCRIINAVHPVVPSRPTPVAAVAGYGGAHVTWHAPASDGGAPWSSYRVRALPNGPSVTVGPRTLATTVLGLKPSTKYSFSVVATNVAGASAAATSPMVTTEKEPPAQTSPAPVSTSRYIRNVRGASATDLAAMRREGATDARNNPSGHGYLVLLAVGGQDESRHGVVLTAGIRFVSYGDMLRDLRAYVDGYASAQRVSAPVTLAVQTNNDIDVSKSSGANFARQFVIPLRQYAARYPGITIAGSDDMEPGFRASYAQTSSWLSGFLATTAAPFVFSGSADGCAYTYANGRCNNGWTMGGMYHLARGVSVRALALPQIYNETMAKQWRYISLTGVGYGAGRINFGGALTEYVACAQARSCGSLTGRTAWSYLWAQLRADSRLRPRSLPYSTDLRIDS